MENKIRESGKKEIDAIMKDAENESKRIKSEFEAEASVRSDKLIKDAENEAELVKRRILADTKLVAKEVVDNKRNEFIEKVFEETTKKVDKLSTAEKKKIMIKLAEEGKKQIEEPVLFVDKKYASLLKGAKIASIGEFGVVVKSKKGESEVNNTISRKMEQFGSTLRHDIAEVLFK